MGPSQSVFRGKKSTEEKLSGLTTGLAVSFIVLSMLVSYVFSRI
ncbi:preprotein translocase subunit SecG [bacterium CPR1]|nr:preprotein translocase subunit SecG [bacterium CPR1]